MIKHLLISAGLAFMPFACSSDEEETEEPVQMPGDEMGMESAELGDPSATDPAGLGADDAAGFGSLPGDAIGSAAADMVGDAASSAMGGEGSLFVRCHVLRVRSGPGMSHKTVGYKTYNEELTSVDASNPKWTKIGEGQFVSRRYLNVQKNSKPHIPAH